MRYALRASLALGLLACALLFGTAAASGATFAWGLSTIGDTGYSLIRTLNTTYNPGGTPRIRFDVDNAHTVYIRYGSCGGPLASTITTIPAHDQTYHEFGVSYAFNTCILVWAESALHTQILSGYILA